MTHVIVPELLPGLYRHYKGNTYDVVGVGIDTETEEAVVIYRALYETNVPFWVRPYIMFIEDVIVNGNKLKRFTKIDDSTPS